MGDIQESFPFEQNTYFTIPFSINRVCVLYYSIRGEFNRKQCSKNLKFIDDKTVQKINNSSHAHCLFGEPITGSMCSIFRIEFTLKPGTPKSFCPYFGFVVSSSISDSIANLKTVRTWNKHIIEFIQLKGKKFTHYNMSMHLNQFSWNGVSSIKHDKLVTAINDKVMFEHNFASAQCTAYHNGKKFHSFEMKEACIIPTLSLHYEGERVCVT